MKENQPRGCSTELISMRKSYFDALMARLAELEAKVAALLPQTKADTEDKSGD